MKKLILVLVVLITSLAAQAQNPIAKGQAQLNAGLGFSGWGVPIYGGLDYGVHKDVTIGGEVAFRSYSNHWHGNKYDHTIFSMLFNRITTLITCSKFPRTGIFMPVPTLVFICGIPITITTAMAVRD